MYIKARWLATPSCEDVCAGADRGAVVMTTRARPRVMVLAQCSALSTAKWCAHPDVQYPSRAQREFDVSVVPFSRRVHQPLASERAWGQQKLKEIVTDIGVPIPVPSEESFARRVWDHLRSVLTHQPYIRYEYRSDDFRRELLNIVRRNPPQLVHLDSIDLEGWLEDLPAVPVACTHHDIEPQLLRLRATRMDGAFAGRYLRHQANLVERLMQVVCPRVDLNVVMSELDAARLQSIAPGSKTHVAPNGVDTEYFMPMAEVPLIPGRNRVPRPHVSVCQSRRRRIPD